MELHFLCIFMAGFLQRHHTTYKKLSMKKGALVFMAAIVGLFAACSDLSEMDFHEKSDDGNLVEQVIFEVPEIRYLIDDNLETRASLSQEGNNDIQFSWEATDTVGIYPDKGSQVFFEMVDGIGTNVAHFDGGGWALRENSTYSAYYPFVCNMKLDRNAIPVSFTGQSQTGVSNYSGTRFYLASHGTSSSTGSLRFKFLMLNTVFRLKASGLPAGSYSKLSITTDEPLFLQQGTFGLDDLSIKGKTYSNTLEISLKDFKLTETSTAQNPVLFYLTAAPVDLRGHKVTVQVYSDDGSVYKCEKTPGVAHEAGAWVGWTCAMKDESVKYTKVSSIYVGGTYLIVDANDQRLFKGATNGSYDNVSIENNVIVDNKGTLAGYEFTVENSGNNYYLKFNDGNYLVCNYSGNAAGLGYVNSQSGVTYPYALTTGYNGAFFFSTTQSNDSGQTGQVLYFKSEENRFKIGGSGSSVGVHLYLKEGTPEHIKQDRGLSFNPASVTCILGETPQKPVLSGTYTTVTYSSSDSKIATVSANGTVTPVAAGTVTITASVAEDEQYSAGSATYTLQIRRASTAGTYVRVTSTDQIKDGGEYVIAYVDGSTKKAFKPILNAGKNGFQTTNNAVDVIIVDDEIDAADADACRFTINNQDGTLIKYSLIVPEADGSADYYWYVNRNGVFTAAKVDSSADTGYRSTFALSPDGKLTLTGTNSYVFRYSSGNFTAATGPGANNLYLFVRSDGAAKQKQTLSFNNATVTWNLGTDCEIGKSYNPQTVYGAQTAVTYSSDQESVAKIENGKIKVVSAGSATITATAEKTDKYYGATASYTLRIFKAPSQDWEDLGSFSLENRALQDYLTDATSHYSDDDDDTNSVMATYAASSAYDDIDRKDCPNPVTIKWTYSAASSSTVVTIYEDKSLSGEVWSQNATANSTSADVFNLIPGRTYYYTVSEGSTVWEKGYFNTTGRRRMIKVSNVEKKGHANNCRDLGGLEVTDKGTKKAIKYGYIFRGTNMDKTTDTEKPILTNFLNIGMDIDLRNGRANSSGYNDDGNSTCYQPFTTGYNVGYISPGFDSFTDLTTASKVKNVLTAIFDTAKKGKASYFHCYIGADRTGYIAMLIEGLLGVSEKDCSIDYELTSFSEAAGLRYRTGRPQDYYFRQGIDFLRKQSGNTFQDKIENYVKSIGITQSQIDEFKSIVLQ